MRKQDRTTITTTTKFATDRVIHHCTWTITARTGRTTTTKQRNRSGLPLRARAWVSTDRHQPNGLAKRPRWSQFSCKGRCAHLGPKRPETLTRPIKRWPGMALLRLAWVGWPRPKPALVHFFLDFYGSSL